jgi:hypothetical protein
MVAEVLEITAPGSDRAVWLNTWEEGLESTYRKSKLGSIFGVSSTKLTPLILPMTS